MAGRGQSVNQPMLGVILGAAGLFNVPVAAAAPRPDPKPQAAQSDGRLAHRGAAPTKPPNRHPPKPTPKPAIDADRDGSPRGVDCDDTDPLRYPGMKEVCDQRDNNCAGGADAGLPTRTYYRDHDRDGFGLASSATESCTPPDGYIAVSGDCDDHRKKTHPGATEVPYNGHDDDCTPDSPDDDLDGDGFALARDCDDHAKSVNPAASEVCDGVDNDCDGKVDEGVKKQYFGDSDGDGYGDAQAAVMACPKDKPATVAENSLDCDDRERLVNPAAAESCDGRDNDCDGNVDEGLPLANYFRDADGDGYGDSRAVVLACGPLAGYAKSAGDCADQSADANPAMDEIPNNGIDDDCDPETPDEQTAIACQAGESYWDGDQSWVCTSPSTLWVDEQGEIVDTSDDEFEHFDDPMPASGNWVSSVTLGEPGPEGYYCLESTGCTWVENGGEIYTEDAWIVSDEDLVFVPISADGSSGLSGWVCNPAVAACGVMVTGDGTVVAAIHASYDPNHPSVMTEPGSNDQGQEVDIRSSFTIVAPEAESHGGDSEWHAYPAGFASAGAGELDASIACDPDADSDSDACLIRSTATGVEWGAGWQFTIPPGGTITVNGWALSCASDEPCTVRIGTDHIYASGGVVPTLIAADDESSPSTSGPGAEPDFAAPSSPTGGGDAADSGSDCSATACTVDLGAAVGPYIDDFGFGTYPPDAIITGEGFLMQCQNPTDGCDITHDGDAAVLGPGWTIYVPAGTTVATDTGMYTCVNWTDGACLFVVTDQGTVPLSEGQAPRVPPPLPSPSGEAAGAGLHVPTVTAVICGTGRTGDLLGSDTAAECRANLNAGSGPGHTFDGRPIATVGDCMQSEYAGSYASRSKQIFACIDAVMTGEFGDMGEVADGLFSAPEIEGGGPPCYRVCEFDVYVCKWDWTASDAAAAHSGGCVSLLPRPGSSDSSSPAAESNPGESNPVPSQPGASGSSAGQSPPMAGGSASSNGTTDLELPDTGYATESDEDSDADASDESEKPPLAL